MKDLPTTFWVGMAAAIVVALGLVVYVCFDNRRRAHRMLEEFIRMFPGRCPLCSYHRYALEHGADFPLGPHVCIEGNSPPEPLPSQKAQKWTKVL